MSPQETPENDDVRWDDRWPSAQVVSTSLVRMVVVPRPAEVEVDASTKWQLTAGRGLGGGVVIFGEIIRVVERFFVAVAARASIRFGPDAQVQLDTDDALDAALLLYGPWVSHTLWDFGRPLVVQATSALALQSPVDIPTTTPEPTLLTKQMLAEQRKEAKRRTASDSAGETPEEPGSSD